MAIDQITREGELEEYRNQMIVLIRSNRRVVPRDMPTEWRPTEVVNPESRMPFTFGGAWHLIADKLEEGHPVEKVKLRNPSGKTGYVLKIDAGQGQKIYIKLQFGNGCVIGRSFHYSKIEEKE
jgi:hypothetical protein